MSEDFGSVSQRSVRADGGETGARSVDDIDRTKPCDSCGQSLVSFSIEKLQDGTCPFCKEPFRDDDRSVDAEVDR